MIIEKEGNLLEAEENIIAHQVNCQGVMRSGIALQIAKKHPLILKKYKEICKSTKPENLLGECQIILVSRKSPFSEEDDLFTYNSTKYFVNLFSQFGYGNKGRYTRYSYLKECLITLKEFAKPHNLSIALPYKIGCGRGGGDWIKVRKIINDVFDDYDVTLYKFDERKLESQYGKR
ncbi:hypothetical protein Goe21_01070 [Bacillus phage vB_BsuM-Goe21]|nr:hypothetical protein Goe21_01070 [Bacillus phage vB_BsuM-Goe21]